jgi:hypothetical protein
MDVKLQIFKHLPRDAHPTVAIIDEYCGEYKDLFKEVRNYDCFKYLCLGIMSSIKKIVTRDSESCKHKLCTVILSFFSEFRLVSR